MASQILPTGEMGEQTRNLLTLALMSNASTQLSYMSRDTLDQLRIKLSRDLNDPTADQHATSLALMLVNDELFKRK